jgi:phage shock protein C
MNNGKKLMKSSSEKRLSGVCGGLADFFDVDVTLVRLLFVIFTLMGGPGLIIYIVLALVLPEDKAKNDDYGYGEKAKNDDYA